MRKAKRAREIEYKHKGRLEGMTVIWLSWRKSDGERETGTVF